VDSIALTDTLPNCNRPWSRSASKWTFHLQSASPHQSQKNLIRPFFTITPSTAFNLKQNLILKILAKRSHQTGGRKIEIFSWPFDIQTPEYLVRQKDRFSGPSMVVGRPVELPSDDVDRANSASGPSNPGQHQSRQTGEARRLFHSLFCFGCCFVANPRCFSHSCLRRCLYILPPSCFPLSFVHISTSCFVTCDHRRIVSRRKGHHHHQPEGMSCFPFETLVVFLFLLVPHFLLLPCLYCLKLL